MWRLRAPLLALLLMQVILLASSGVTATKKPLGKQETCNMKNHMIEYLRNNGVQIYERPQISSEVCKGEWSEFGTCCAPSSLRSFRQNKLSTNQQALDLQIREMTIATEMLTDLRDKYLLEGSATNRDWTVTTSNPRSGPSGTVLTDSAVPVEQPRQSHSITAQLDQLLTKLKNAQTQRIQMQEKCVSKINQIISIVACSICSGRSDDFFDETFEKLKVSPTLLYEVLKECHPAWASLVEFQQDVDKYTDLVLSTSGYSCGSGNKCLESQAITMTVSTFIKKRNLIPNLDNCSPGLLETCEYKHVAALCEQFIHIQDSGYAPKVEEEAESVIKAVESTQMTVSAAQNLYQEFKAALQIEGTDSITLPSLGERLTQIRSNLKQLWRKIVSFYAQWSQVQRFRVQVVSLSRLSADLAIKLSQTDKILVQLESVLEDHLADYHITKWKMLRSLIPEIALSNSVSDYITELSQLWGTEATAIEGWAQLACTTAETAVLTALKSRFLENTRDLQGCFQKHGQIERRWMWGRIMTKTLWILTGTSNPSMIEAEIDKVFSPLTVGPIVLPDGCPDASPRGMFQKTSNAADQEFPIGFVEDLQCDPCVGSTSYLGQQSHSD